MKHQEAPEKKKRIGVTQHSDTFTSALGKIAKASGFLPRRN
jgi:hypothetical protein